MDIVGGLYREICEAPAWDAVLGSGGRAALAVSGLRRDVRLHTYLAPHWDPPASLGEAGVQVIGRPAPSGLAFVYLHPLSTPHIAPAPADLAPAAPLRVEGELVLRFGLLEGDAVVRARRAVFDPQTSRQPASFRANGSQADDLALVLNQAELRALAGTDDLSRAAAAVAASERASAVVAKGGVYGATVFDPSGHGVWVPAYRSASVFKIGTGDVFSATFTHHWGEGLPAVEAADRASRAVAAYTESRTLPPPPNSLPRPVGGRARGPVLLLGEPSTLARRWLLEEARFRLGELGVRVVCPALEGGGMEPVRASAGLMLPQGLRRADVDGVADASPGLTWVVLEEEGPTGLAPTGALVVADFTSALYGVAWAAAD